MGIDLELNSDIDICLAEVYALNHVGILIIILGYIP